MKTDAQLIREARKDPDALAELYRRHVRTVRSWLRTRTPEAAASELTSETFAQAALSLRRFRDEAAGSALPWLLGIARNLLLRSFEHDRVETAARRRLGLSVSREDIELAAVEERDRAERLGPLLANALAGLPATQRRAVELRVIQELPYEQVASELECSEGAARIRVTRALGSLSRHLKGASS